MSTFRLVTFVFVIAAAPAASALAADCRWTGGGANGNWSTTQNWTSCNGGSPATNDIVTFPEGAQKPENTNNLVGLSLTAIRILGNGAGNNSYQIGGRPVIVRNAVTSSAVADADQSGPRIAMQIVLGADVTVANLNANGGTLVIDQIDLGGFGLNLDIKRRTSVGAILGRGSVYKQGADAVGLGNGSYSGITSVVEGGVFVYAANSLGAAGDDNYTIVSDGGFVQPTNGVVLSESFLIGGMGPGLKGVLRAEGQAVRVTFAGKITIAIADTAIGSHDGAQLIVSSPIVTSAPNNTLQTTGNGAIGLANPGNSWGALLVNNQRLRLEASGVLPDTAPVALIGNALLDLNGHDEIIGSLRASGDGAGIELGNAALTINQLADQTFNGAITGSGRVVKAGSARLTFGGTRGNVYTGLTTVQSGELRLAKTAAVLGVGGSVSIAAGRLVSARASPIADNAAVSIDSSAAWDLYDIEQIASLSGAGTVRFLSAAAGQAGSLAVGATNASMTFNGKIEGAALTPFIKAGTGTLTLTGANTFTGGLSVMGGDLIVDGSLDGVAAVLVDGGRLSGSGRVGHITGSGGATVGPVAPGRSPGVLSGTSAVLGGPLVIELNGASPGANYDQLRLTGGLTLRAGAELRVTKTFTAEKGAAFTIVSAGRAVSGTFAGLAQGAELTIDGQRFRIDYFGGNGHDIVLTAQEGPAQLTYFLAEGATGTFFDEDVLIANPNPREAPVTLTFFKDTGEQVAISRTLAPQSHAVIRVDDIPGLEAAAASVRVTSESGQELFVERSMFWDATSYAGHTGSALPAASPDWFFAEGAQGFFDTYVLVINPNAAPADVTFTFLRQYDSPVVKTVRVGAGSRLTVGAGEFAELHTRSFAINVHATQPIMAERAMYFASTSGRLWGGGHESAGVTAPANAWYLAEGATGTFFDTFILLSNPQSADAKVTVTYLLPSGEAIAVPQVVPASGRLTINPEADGDPRLTDASMSIAVVSDQPIVVERSMYWPGATTPWGEAHNSFGVTAAATDWGLAEGRAGRVGRAPFSTYILLANPQTTAAEVEVTFLRDSGAPIVRTFTVPATGRWTIDASTIEELRDSAFGAAIRVTNGVPIIVERSMYWDANGIFWSGGTNATGIRRVP